MIDEESPTMSDPTRPPRRTIGTYELIRLLGQGGMGEVWLARDTALQREVAIKLLPKSILTDSGAARRFLREARTAAQLNHPNGVTIHQVGEQDGQLFIVMELVEGGSLADELKRRGPFPWREATQAIRDAAAGLAAAHEVGLIHRDIKPSNLMRTGRGFVKVVDFGLARAASDTTELTRPGTVLGTPAYMSPEQGRGEKVDGRSDLYSLACTYYALVAGKPPFRGESSTAVIYQHVHEPVPDVQQVVPDLPDGVVRVITRGMKKNPAERYQTAAELIADLDAVTEESADQGMAEVRRLARTITKTAPTTPAGASRWRSALAALIITFVVALVGVGSWLAWRHWLSATPSELPNEGATIPAVPTAEIPRPAGTQNEQADQELSMAIGKELHLDLGGNVTMKLVRIPAGTFLMGSPETETGREKYETQHKVTISKPFYLGVTGVTRRQFQAFVELAGYQTDAEKRGWGTYFAGGRVRHIPGRNWENPGYEVGPDHPVACVTWDDANRFCQWLAAKTGRSLRLPTEAEREYACRAGTTTTYQWGNDPTDGEGWCNVSDQTLKDALKLGRGIPGILSKGVCKWRDGYAFAAPVGRFHANAWGLFDMHGNLLEWCADWFQADYYNMGGRVDPQGPRAGTQRVIRGGCFDVGPPDFRSAARGGGGSGFSGFRHWLPGMLSNGPGGAGAGETSWPTEHRTFGFHGIRNEHTRADACYSDILPATTSRDHHAALGGANVPENVRHPSDARSAAGRDTATQPEHDHGVKIDPRGNVPDGKSRVGEGSPKR